jgi:hypothetical protein
MNGGVTATECVLCQEEKKCLKVMLLMKFTRQGVERRVRGEGVNELVVGGQFK